MYHLLICFALFNVGIAFAGNALQILLWFSGSFFFLACVGQELIVPHVNQLNQLN